MSKITFGKSIEYKVASEMMREGFDVYYPTADDHGVDFVAKTPQGNIVEIQVKARSKTSKSGVFSAIKHTKTANYYFVFYMESLDKTWVLSSNDFLKNASLNTTGINVGTYSLNVLSKGCNPFCVSDYHTIV